MRGFDRQHPTEDRVPEGDWRKQLLWRRRKEQVWERVQAITRDLGVPVDRLPENSAAVLPFEPRRLDGHPGMRSLRNVDANVRAAELGPLSVEELEVLRHHRWVRNLLPGPLDLLQAPRECTRRHDHGGQLGIILAAYCT